MSLPAREFGDRDRWLDSQNARSQLDVSVDYCPRTGAYTDQSV